MNQHNFSLDHEHQEPTRGEEEEYSTPIEERPSDRRLALSPPPQEWEAWALESMEETEEVVPQTPEVVLFTFGYLSDFAEETLQAVATWGSLIVDIRSRPTSRHPLWRKKALEARYGERYLSISALGNLNYKTKGLITLARPEEGIEEVVDLLTSGQSVTLLCACRDHEHCHRALVASLIRERLPQIPLRHMPLPLEMPECMSTLDTSEIGD